MRMSQSFTQTLREPPAGVDLPGYQYLLRAGFCFPVSAGVLAALPLGERAARRLEQFARRVIGLQGAQEISLPMLLPADLSNGPDISFTDAGGRSMVLAEDRLLALASLLPKHIRSHRQLPARLVSCEPSWHDEPRPNGGWLSARYDRALSFYHLLPDRFSLDEATAQLSLRLQEFFDQLHLPARPVEAEPGTDRWFYPFAPGIDNVLSCPACGYAAQASWAGFGRQTPLSEDPQPLEKVATPHCPTIDSLAQFLGVPAARTAKAVFLTAAFTGTQALIFAVVRGDRDLSEPKLRHLTGARSVRPATDAEISAAGAVPGYASPVGLKDTWVIVDEDIPTSPNLVSGANEAGFHLLNVNYGRDYTARQVADIAAAREGDPCPCCQNALRAESGVFVAYHAIHSPLAGCDFVNESGQSIPLQALSAEISLYRTLACLAEQHHDEHGLRWPRAAAPFDLGLVLLPVKTGQAEAQVIALYARLQEDGWEVLFDDRTESPGVKFKDADLIGLPLRLTISERALAQGGIEFKPRRDGEMQIVPVDEAPDRVRGILANE